MRQVVVIASHYGPGITVRRGGPGGGRSGTVVAGGIGPPRPVRPLFEPGAAAVRTEPDNPQITVFLAERVPVMDLGPDHRYRPVDGQDLRGQGEDLFGPFPLLVPHPPDRVQP